MGGLLYLWRFCAPFAQKWRESGVWKFANERAWVDPAGACGIVGGIESMRGVIAWCSKNGCDGWR